MSIAVDRSASVTPETTAIHPGITVVGGTYVDIELTVSGPITPDTSLEITQRSRVLGGPGFCFAIQLARSGFRVDLRTILGACVSSERARQALLDHGIHISGEQDEGDLDVAILVIERTGHKLALNDYRLARRVVCAPDLLGSSFPLLIASPTSIPSLVEAIHLVRDKAVVTPVYLAPHSFQVRQIKRLSGADRAALASVTVIACFHESDFDVELDEAFPAEVHLIVTRGAHGCRLRHLGNWSDFPAPILTGPITNPNGAGEAFFSGVLAAIARGYHLEHAIEAGAFAAQKHLTNSRDSIHSMSRPAGIGSLAGGD